MSTTVKDREGREVRVSSFDPRVLATNEEEFASAPAVITLSFKTRRGEAEWLELSYEEFAKIVLYFLAMTSESGTPETVKLLSQITPLFEITPKVKELTFSAFSPTRALKIMRGVED